MRRVDAHHPTQLVYCQIVPEGALANKKTLAYAGVYGKRSDGEGPKEPGQDEAECLANARLIAASPTLLAACQFAFEELRSVIAITFEQQQRITAARDRLNVAMVDAKARPA